MGVDVENSSLVSEENRLVADVEFEIFLVSWFREYRTQ